MIVENLELSGSAMPLNRRYKGETRRGSLVVSLMALTKRQEFATFYVTSRLHEQCFVFDK